MNTSSSGSPSSSQDSSDPIGRPLLERGAPSPVASFRLTEGSDPEERLEEAALWKAMHDAFGCAIVPVGAAGCPTDVRMYGRPTRAERGHALPYWSDPAFLREANRSFRLSSIEGIGEAVHELHAAGKGAFIKSTRDKHAIFRVPVGVDPRAVIGDFAYSFIDGGPLLMVQELCEVTYEWRFFCVGRQIVTHTTNAARLTPLDFMRAGAYRTPADQAESASASVVAWQLRPVAERIAAQMQTEDAVIDCAFINGTPACVELNPMILGGVGLFACDVRRLAEAVRDRDFPALSSETPASLMGAISDQGKDTRDEQTASLLSRLKEATADAAAYAETAKAQREWKEEAEADLQAAEARIKVLEGALERLTGAVERMREADDLPSPPATAEMLRSAWRSVGEAATAARSALPQLGGENG